MKFIKKLLGKKKKPYQSETAKVRHLVARYCTGYGCDVGFGGDKIVKENCDGIDFAKPYAYTGDDKVDIACDLFRESIPVKSNSYDFVYSSHMIEDFADTQKILEELIRVLKSGGNLILVFPDQPVYAMHCRKTGQPVNLLHIHDNMGLSFMQNCLYQIRDIEIENTFISNCEVDYNVIMVCKILKR